jgi:hypothetical protein
MGVIWGISLSELSGGRGMRNMYQEVLDQGFRPGRRAFRGIVAECWCSSVRIVVVWGDSREGRRF